MVSRNYPSYNWKFVSFEEELMLLNFGAGEDSWESLRLEIKPVNPKGNQTWIFIGRTDVKLKLQYFGYLMQRAKSLEKTDAGKDWGQEKGAAEDEMVG